MAEVPEGVPHPLSLPWPPPPPRPDWVQLRDIRRNNLTWIGTFYTHMPLLNMCPMQCKRFRMQEEKERGGGKGNKKGEYEKGGKKGIKREKEDDKL